MATIAGLSVGLSLDSATFIRESRRATQATDRMRREMGTHNRRLQRSFAGVSSAVRTLTTTLGALGVAVGVAGLVRIGRQSLETADQIAKAADRAGIATDAYQALSFQASQTGVSQSQLNTAMVAFGRRAAEAREGSGPLISVLKTLNPELLRAVQNSQNNADALRLVADAMAEAEGEGQALAIAQAAFSEAGRGLVLTFRDGADSIDRFAAKARDLGLIIDEEMLRSAEDTNDALDVLQRTINARLTSAIVEAAPQIQRFAGAFADAVPQIVSTAAAIGDLAAAFIRLDTAKLPPAVQFLLTLDVPALRARNAALRELFDLLSGISTALANAGQGLGSSARMGEMIESDIERFENLARAMRDAREAASEGPLTVDIRGGQARPAPIPEFKPQAEVLRFEAEAAREAARALEERSQAIRESNRDIQELNRRRGQTLTGLRRENEETRRIAAARQQGADAVREVITQIEIENTLLEHGLSARNDQGQAIAEEIRQRAELTDQMERNHQAAREEERAQRQAQRERERAAREAERLMTQPFENALRSIQSSITDTFENIFSGGVNSFKDLAGEIKDIFIRLAAEIATVMVIRGTFAGVGGVGGLAGGVGGGGGLLGTGVQAASLFGGAGGGGASTFGASTFGAGTIGAQTAGLFGGPAQTFGAGSIGAQTANLFGGGAGAGASFGTHLGYGAVGTAAGMGVSRLAGAESNKAGDIGGGVGGVVGGVAGSYFGPVGTAVGSAIGSALGSAIGGAFGGGNEANRQALATIGQGGDVFRRGGGDPSKETREAVTAVGEQITSLLKGIEEIAGESFRQRIQVGIGERDKSRVRVGGGSIFDPGTIRGPVGDVQETLKIALEEIAKQFDELEPLQQRVLKRSIELRGADVQKILEDVQFAQSLQEMKNPLTALQKEFRAVNEQFGDLKRHARELGLETGRLDRAHEQAIEAVRTRVRAEREAVRNRARELAGVELTRELPLWRRELSAVLAQFGELRKQARALGIDTAFLTRLRKQAVEVTKEEIRAERRSVIDRAEALVRGQQLTDVQGAVARVVNQFKELKTQALDLGLGTARLNRLQKEAVEATRERAIAEQRQAIEQRRAELAQRTSFFTDLLDPLREFQQQLQVGPLSAFSPQRQFEAAQGQFQDAAQAARGGDISAIQSLPEFGRQFIEQAREFGASPALASAVDQVSQVLQSVADPLEEQRDRFTALVDMPDRFDNTVQAQTRALSRGLQELKEEIREMSAEMRRTIRKTAAA